MNSEKERITIERTYKASVQELWDLWTTKEGIESWWGPDGFMTTVLEIDVRTGGRLVYEMTAVAAAQMAFMKQARMPLTNQNRITYRDVLFNRRIGYTHVADFIPGVEPYDVDTLVEFHVDGESVRMVLTFDPMHDAQWTRRAVMGHEGQLGKLDRLIAARSRGQNDQQKTGN